MAEQRDVDVLISESQRLREELLKTAARLEGFAEALVAQVTELRKAAEKDKVKGKEEGK